MPAFAIVPLLIGVGGKAVRKPNRKNRPPLHLFLAAVLVAGNTLAETQPSAPEPTKEEMESLLMEQGRFMLCTKERKVGWRTFMTGTGGGIYPVGLTEERVQRLLEDRLEFAQIDHQEIEDIFPFPENVELVLTVQVVVHPPVQEMDTNQAFARIDMVWTRPLQNPLGFTGVGMTAVSNSTVYGNAERIMQSVQEDVEDLIRPFSMVYKDPLCRAKEAN